MRPKLGWISILARLFLKFPFPALLHSFCCWCQLYLEPNPFPPAGSLGMWEICSFLLCSRHQHDGKRPRIHRPPLCIQQQLRGSRHPCAFHRPDYCRVCALSLQTQVGLGQESQNMKEIQGFERNITELDLKPPF